MTREQRPTAFVTGAAGFIGAELIKVLVAAGHDVLGLVRAADEAERVRHAGAIPILGDLLKPGRWQDEAAAGWVFHVVPNPLPTTRVSRRSAAAIAGARVLMDAHLLEAIAAGATRRIVYVADTSCYGATGPDPITEDEPLRPSAWGRRLHPALERLDHYIVAGLPIVTAMPGWVYGNGSWFRAEVIDPVTRGDRVLQFGRVGPRISPVHVHDCARALLYLADRGEPGGRYFVVNSEPHRLHDLASTFARLAGRPLHVRRLPEAARRVFLGSLLAEHLRSDAVFSNIRLRGIGFRFLYPTLEEGLTQVVACHE